MILKKPSSIIIIISTLYHPLPDCQLLVDIAVGPVAGPDTLVLRHLEVLLPDAPVLAQLDDLLALLNTQQVGDNETLEGKRSMRK